MKRVPSLLIALLLLTIASQTIACEPNIRIKVVNATSTELDLAAYINNPPYSPYYLGLLKPGKSIKYTFKGKFWAANNYSVHVLAKNTTGEILYYRQLYYDEARKLGYTLTIKDEPPWKDIPPWAK